MSSDVSSSPSVIDPRATPGAMVVVAVKRDRMPRQHRERQQRKHKRPCQAARCGAFFVIEAGGDAPQVDSESLPTVEYNQPSPQPSSEGGEEAGEEEVEEGEDSPAEEKLPAVFLLSDCVLLKIAEYAMHTRADADVLITAGHISADRVLWRAGAMQRILQERALEPALRLHRQLTHPVTGKPLGEPRCWSWAIMSWRCDEHFC